MSEASALIRQVKELEAESTRLFRENLALQAKLLLLEEQLNLTKEVPNGPFC